MVGASFTNTQSTTATTPFVDVQVDLPVALGGTKAGTKASTPVRLQAESVFSGSPSQTEPSALSPLTPESLGTFAGISFQASIHYVIGMNGGTRTTVSIQGGGTSRFATGALQPATQNPGHGDVCVGLYRVDHQYSFSFCPLSFTNEVGDPATASRADGRVTINNAIRLQVSVVYPWANAPSNWYAVNTVHNIMTTAAVAVDVDHVLNPPAASTSNTVSPAAQAMWDSHKHAPPTL
jgi:hypothetical protein